jgi:Flp pilus assembly pilin Flp
MQRIHKLIRSMAAFADDAGATAIEYALIGTLIAAITIGSLTALGNSAVGLFGTIGDAMVQSGGAQGAGPGGGVSAGGGFGASGIVSAGSGIGVTAF